MEYGLHAATALSDSLMDGRKVRVFNVLDDCNREALAIECGLSFPAQRVIRVMNQLEEEIGLPRNIRVDNGPEFISHDFRDWCDQRDINIKYIQPGKPMQNGYIERFNRFFREDVLDAYWFEDLGNMRMLAEKWRTDYNHKHPHKSLGGNPPSEYKSRCFQGLTPENNDLKTITF